MSIIISSTEKQQITKIVCPECKEKVKSVGLLKESKIEGLTFRCRKCGAYKTVKTE